MKNKFINAVQLYQEKCRSIMNWYPFCIMVAVILFKPAYFAEIPVLDKAYDLVQILAGLLIGITYLFEVLQKRKANPIVVLVVSYYAILILSTLVNSGDLKMVLVRSANFIVICMMFDLLATYNFRGLVSSLTLLFEVFAYVNFITILIFPKGFYRSDIFSAYYWFLGYKNQMINLMLPAICMSILNYYQTKPRTSRNWVPWTRTFALILVTVLSAVLAHSGASTIMTAGMLLFWLLQGYMVDKIFNFRNYLILNIALFFIIVVFRMQNLFAFIIEDVLHRNLTLTGRTVIWDRTNELIAQKPILGYGVQHYEDRMALYGIKTKWINKVAGLHAHDRYLETIYRGGALLLIDYLAILFATNRYLMKFRKTKAAKVIAFTLFIYLTGMLTEFYDFSPMFFALMTLAYHCDKLDVTSGSQVEKAERVE